MLIEPFFARALHPGNYLPMIITVAMTGAVPSKEKYPNLPTTPNEIIQTALECADAGASTVHVHLRDDDGFQTQNLEMLEEVISGIRLNNSDLIICATTTSRGIKNPEDRLVPFLLPPDLRPDMASLTLGSYNTPTGINANPAEEIETLLAEMKKNDITPELEIFEPGMLHTWFQLVTEGKTSPQGMINILLGVRGASPATAKGLVDIVNVLPGGAEWAVAGIGHFQRPMTVLGAVAGGNVRVGLEDDPRGEFDGWTNVDSVKRAVRVAEFVGRGVASPSESRKRLGLGSKIGLNELKVQS